MHDRYKILLGDCIESMRSLPDKSVYCCVTSPPYYGLRDYGHDRQIGLEETPEDFVNSLVSVFREVKRVLRDDGTLWVNIGDSYASTKVGNTNGTSGKVVQKSGVNEDKRKRTIPEGLKHKDLMGIPWRVAFALQADGWYLRQDIIWNKPNPMPESVTDRCTKSHEYIFLLSKSKNYYYDAESIKEPVITNDAVERNRDITRLNNTPGRTRMGGLVHNDYEVRNKRSVWTVTTKPLKEAHFAAYPADLIEPCIIAGCPLGGTVLDPFMGSGTTAIASLKHGRKAIGCELNPDYLAIAHKRIKSESAQLDMFNDSCVDIQEALL